MPRWQHISYSVVVIELTEKVQPEGGGILGFRNYCVNISNFVLLAGGYLETMSGSENLCYLSHALTIHGNVSSYFKNSRLV